MLIDIHAHLGCPQADGIYRAGTGELPPRLPFTCAETDQVNARMFAAIGPKLNDIDCRIADMDRMDVGMQILSPNPAQFFYGAPDEIARETSCAINNCLAEAVARHPDRFAAMGTVPLQNCEMAIAEMRRAVGELGFRGIEIGTYVDGRELADPSLSPFFAAAEELGIVLFMHPLGFSHGERLSRYYLNNILGNPIESSIALAHLIFGGVLDRHPGLKLCVAHGGGFLPSYWGRLDHAWRAREDCRLHIDRPPSSYLRQIWTDTLVFDQNQLALLVDAHGAGRMCLGTDYPFDMAEPDPRQFHGALPGDVHAAICGRNAVALFNLSI